MLTILIKIPTEIYTNFCHDNVYKGTFLEHCQISQGIKAQILNMIQSYFLRCLEPNLNTCTSSRTNGPLS